MAGGRSDEVAGRVYSFSGLLATEDTEHTEAGEKVCFNLSLSVISVSSVANPFFLE
jgi:hypothetical protein